MLDSYMKTKKNALLEKILPTRLKLIHPNIYSVLGFILFLPVFFLLINGFYGYGLFVFAVSRIFDGFDGFAAKYQDIKSTQGSILDQSLDLIVYALFLVAVGIEKSDNQSWISITIVLSTYYVNIYLSMAKSSHLRQSRNIIEGTETLGVYALILVFNAHVFYILTGFALILSIGIVNSLFLLLKQEHVH